MIKITVEGGVIQDITDIPEGTVVQVIELDTDGIEEQNLSTLKNGEKAMVVNWPARRS